MAPAEGSLKKWCRLIRPVSRQTAAIVAPMLVMSASHPWQLDRRPHADHEARYEIPQGGAGFADVAGRARWMTTIPTTTGTRHRTVVTHSATSSPVVAGHTAST